MYFSSLKDEELDYFHKTINASFTMSLTDILSSDLFKVDEVVEDVLYRIYPLFYCTNAISSNPKDKILDNKCFICTVGEHETYMSFTKGEGDNLIIDESSMTLYDIGDSLSADEFNAMVYRLRHTEVLSGKLDFEETTTITGLYGTYELLHTENQPKNDYGYIINNNVKDNPISVKLTNPFFDKANYHLTCTVISITGANVFDESDEQYVHSDEFTVDLNSEQEVMLDVSEYSNDSVLKFDMKLDIDFKVAEIMNSNYSLALTTSPSPAYYGDNVTLSATLTSTDAGVTGYAVRFYEEDTLIATETTNINGVAITTVTPTTTGIHNYNATSLGIHASTGINILKLQSQLAVSVQDTNIGKTATANITMTPPITTTAKLYFNNRLLSNISIINGTNTSSLGLMGIKGQKTVTVVFDGDSIYNPSNATTTFTVYGRETRFTNQSATGNTLTGLLQFRLNPDSQWGQLGTQTVTVKGAKHDESFSKTTTVTTTRGVFTFDSTSWRSDAIEYIKFTYAGDDDTYESCETSFIFVNGGWVVYD